MSRNLFVTATGTEIGKTYVAGLIARTLQEAGLKAAYYKAAMSGSQRRPDGTLIPGDALFVKEFAHLSQSLESMCPYVLGSQIRINSLCQLNFFQAARSHLPNGINYCNYLIHMLLFRHIQTI